MTPQKKRPPGRPRKGDEERAKFTTRHIKILNEDFDGICRVALRRRISVHKAITLAIAKLAAEEGGVSGSQKTPAEPKHA